MAFVEPGQAVLKRCSDPRYRDWLRREREVLVAVESASLSVPRVLDYLDLEDDVWMVMTRVPGTSCSTVLARSDRTSRRALLGSVGTSLRRLHATPVPHELRTPGDWMERRLDEAQGNLAWCEGSPELLRRLAASKPRPVPPVLIHGDLNLENLLTNGTEVTGLVDWAAGDCGDPRCDVALVLQPDEDLGIDSEEQEAFFNAYGCVVSAETRRWFEELYEFF